MFNDHYIPWRESRMKAVAKYIVPGYFESKTLLELGCGHGEIGLQFHELGADVTCSDARKEYLSVVNPQLKTLELDCDTEAVPHLYDIIVHWGLLYHLHEIDNHLEMISQKCNVLLLETEVCDSDDKTYLTTDEVGFDQAFNGKGIRPSASYVEDVLAKNGFQFKIIKDSILNTSVHRYDWKVTDEGRWKHGLRRFWICWKNVESPLSTQ